MMDGIVIVNKPTGITSHDVVDFVRNKFHMRRVGHAGTLDPLASGVLIILLGQSTKLFDRFSAFDKAYRATLRLGLKTTTADITGKTIVEKSPEGISCSHLEEVFKKFIGPIEQRPPMVSALKHKGVRLYKIAWKGQEVERPFRQVRIDDLKVLRFALPEVEFFVSCSKGTYVRQLAEDVGEMLGCGACIAQIERTRVGDFDIKDAVSLEDLNEGHIRAWGH